MMFTNFFDGKQNNNNVSQKTQSNRTNKNNDENRKIPAKTLIEDLSKKKTIQQKQPISAINKSNIDLNQDHINQQKITDRKCATPDNQTIKANCKDKAINIFKHMKGDKFESQNKGYNLFLNKQNKINKQSQKNLQNEQYQQYNTQVCKTDTNTNLPIYQQQKQKLHQFQQKGGKQNLGNILNDINQMKKLLQTKANNKKQNNSTTPPNNKNNINNQMTPSKLSMTLKKNQALQQKINNQKTNMYSTNNKVQKITQPKTQTKMNREADSSEEDNRRDEQIVRNNRLIYYSKINDWEKSVQLLNKKGNLDINCKDESEWTPLHFACFNKNIQLVELLLLKSPDVEMKTNSGLSALTVATQKNSLQIVHILLTYGSNVNSVDTYGNTALHYACLGDCLKVVARLLETEGLDMTLLNFEKKPVFEMTTNQEILNIFKEFFNKEKEPQKKSQTQACHSMASKRTESGEDEWLGVGLNPDEFHVHGLLGKGSFGEVYLVEKKSSKEIFAMKALDKTKIQKHNLIKYAMTERNVLSLTSHPFIVKLNYAFQTKDKLFLILEFAPGGDLGELLQKQKKFDEESTRIYISEITLALEDLHKKDIIFRDLKPENIVLDQEGHALLTDFGLSKEGVFDPMVGARSFCGSVAYLAPEMLKRAGHGKAVDWYLLGVVMYEMLIGIPPYYANSREQLFHNIENGVLKIPSSISQEAKSLMKALLQRNPLKRLGSGKGDADEIKCHPFFQNLDWQQVLDRKLNPPKISHKIKINPKYTNNVVFSQTIFKTDDEYISGWSFVNNENS